MPALQARRAGAACFAFERLMAVAAFLVPGSAGWRDLLLFGRKNMSIHTYVTMID